MQRSDEVIISARVITWPRKVHYCDDCGFMCLDGMYLRAYGYAEHGDPRYVLRFCLGCAGKSLDKKFRAALGAIKESNEKSLQAEDQVQQPGELPV
jgi:hypothetical protein